MDKLILDASCGGRTMWFNKKHPNALYLDIRKTERGLDPNRPNFVVDPDVIGDYRDLQFEDKKFKLVIWDPPHLKNINPHSWIGKKYGSLNGETYKEDLLAGFKECMRVLDDYGILILKWSVSGQKNRDVTTTELLGILPQQPLFGHTTGSKANTIWMTFMRIPETKQETPIPPSTKVQGILGDFL